MKFYKLSIQLGQAVIEYVLLVAVVAIVMLIPIPDFGIPEFVGKTPAEILVLSLKNFFHGLSFFTSVL